MKSMKLIILALFISTCAKPTLELEAMNTGKGSANFLSIIDETGKKLS